MKKRALKAALFVLIFCILFSIANVFVVRVEPYGHKIITEFYDQPQNSLDGVYIGASTGFIYWNSLFAWNKYGICVYPYSCNVNPFYSTEYIIKEARKTQPNATFIVNLNSLSDGELDASHMYNILNSMPPSRNKLELIDHLCDVSGREGTERIEFYLPFLQFHNRWAQFFTDNKIVVRPNGYKGASDYPDYLYNSIDVSENYTEPALLDKLSENLTYSTDKLLNYCKEENVKVLFVDIPQAKDDEYEVNRIETLASYISSKGFSVLNLNGVADEKFNLDLTKDYYDDSHVNIHGSLKYTYYLSEYLIENYGFEDKRSDETYAHWNTSYESYMKMASAHMLDIELDYEHRDFTIDEPVLQVENKNNSVEVTWNQIKNVDGYLIYRKNSESSSWNQIAEASATADALTYTDTSPAEGEKFYYTVVPFVTRNGVNYYGDFNYLGVSTEP
ncbi:MAG: hypothetical protein IKK10_04795 [Clostridia bacterium]|nr:hypothetical protein [Clostridia bacterium]